MPIPRSAEHAKLEVELGQTYYAMESLTDAGDHMEYESTTGPWSDASGKTPDVKPDGVLSGGVLSPASSGTSNKVDVSACTVWIGGTKKSISATTDVSLTRGDATGPYKTSSIVVSGTAYAVVEGTTSASLCTTRNADGGPPYIPVGQVEVGQVRTTSQTAAAVSSSECHQIPNSSKELGTYPGYTIDYENGKLTFTTALNTNHTGGVTKAVWAEYYTPVFSEIDNARNVEPPAQSHSLNSEQVYGPTGAGTVASSSKSLNQGSFEIMLEDGVTEPIQDAVDDMRWYRFYPDRYRDPYLLGRAKLGMTKSYPADGLISGAGTLSAPEAWGEKAS